MTTSKHRHELSIFILLSEMEAAGSLQDEDSYNIAQSLDT